MRLSELSRAAELPSATVKWYLRVGLLPRGHATAANQAQYSDRHVRLLKLARALLEVGGLSIDAARQVIEAVDDADRSPSELLAVAHAALAGDAPAADDPAGLAAVDAVITANGWTVGPDAPARRDLAQVLTALAGLRTAGAPAAGTADDVVALLRPYAAAADAIAAAEIAGTPPDLPRDELAERVVIGTILMERALAALRRLAQEHWSRTLAP